MSDNNNPTGDPTRRDGNIDFTRYATEQLSELQGSIDPDVFPLNFAALIEELRSRSTAVPSHAQWTARLTRMNGLRGWLEGRWRRQPLYGESSVTISGDALTLTGMQRTWLGMPIERALTWPLDRIQNVIQSQATVRLEVRRRGWLAREIELQLASPAKAESLVAALPATRTARFERTGIPLLAFEEQLHQQCPHTWLTPALIVMNVAMFVVTWLSVGHLIEIERSPLTFWAANVGPLTLDGQWWRLITALFAHGSVDHLVLNMWALWHIGRLTERLFGRWTFLSLYLGSGVVASLASLIWDPGRFTLGASGAIFGLFGSFLAVLIYRRRTIPRGVFRAHWIPTVLFVTYCLVTSAFNPVVDNAAHAGGLISGFCLGMLLASSVRDSAQSLQRRRHAVAALVLLVAFVAGASLYLRSAKGPIPVPQQFAASHQWYINGESKNIANWNRLASMASAGAISDDALGSQFERDVLPFWKMALPRLQAELPQLAGELHTYSSAVTRFVELRRDWAQTIVTGVKNSDAEQMDKAREKAEEVTIAMAHLQRLGARANAAQLPGGLTNMRAIRKFRQTSSGKTPDCIKPGYRYHLAVSDKDFRFDGPAQSQIMGCDAQKYFLEEEYQALDTILLLRSVKPADLLDGGSALNAHADGLDALFSSGTYTVEQNLRRLAGWRRRVPTSYFPDLLEAMLYNNMAWSARGHGVVQQVSQQAWAEFAFRNEMAWSAFESTSPTAKQSPLGCQISLRLQHDRENSIETMRRTFDDCIEKHPLDYELYRLMLRRLMPRWGGSADEMSAFIDEVVDSGRAPGPEELYTRLYWMYADLEQDDVNFFQTTKADWPRMYTGFGELRARHFRSDAILNAFAYFSCIAEDREIYQGLKRWMGKGVSTSIWTSTINIAICDAKLK